MERGFCILPWIHLSASTDGVWSRCCVDATAMHSYYGTAERPRMELEEDAVGCVSSSDYARDNPDRVFGLAEAFDSEAMRATRRAMLAGEPVAACAYCHAREAAGGLSYRQEMNAAYADPATLARIVEETEEDGSYPGDPWYLDLRLGNTCNLRCVMCGYPASSRWAAAEDERWHPAALDPYSDNDELWSELRGAAKALRRIYFAGGEPFLQPSHRRLLDLLIDAGASSHIELVYNSNMMLWPDRTVAKLREFKSVGIGASCDGTGDTFEQIRVGASWERFVRNVRAARREFRVWIQVAPQRDNMWNLEELVEWAVGEELDVNLANVVHAPEELSIQSAPAEERARFRQLVRELRQRYPRAEFERLNRDLVHLESFAGTAP